MFKAGGFLFPTVTGSYSVTGLGFRPKSVILIGGNRDEIGSLVSSLTGPGIFLSMNGLDWTDGVTPRHFMLAPFGNSDAGNGGYRAFENGPISMPQDGTSAAAIDYRANSIVFDADGFTINVTTPAPGDRPITWLAWDEQSVMQVGGGGGSPTFPTSFEGLSSLAMNTIAYSPFGEGGVNQNSWFSWGSGHYPKYAQTLAPRPDVYWRSIAIYNQMQFASPLGRQGFMEWFEFFGNVGPSWFSTSGVIDTIGPALLDGWRRFRPHVEVPSFSEFISEGGGGTYNYHADLWTAAEGWCGTVPSISAVDDTADIPTPANFDSFDALIFATLNGPFFAGGPFNAYLAFGLGILGRDYQGCVVFGQDGSFYQSTDECIASTVGGAAHAYSGEFLEDGSVRLTCTKGGAVSNAVWTGFGATPVGVWLPQSYRFLRDRERPPKKT